GIEEIAPSDGLAALGSWRPDVALVDDISTPVLGKENVDFAPLTDDVVHVLVGATHELRARRSVTIADLKHESWALDSTSSAFGEFIINLCRRSGYEPRLNAKCRSFEVAAAMVASGCSISVAPGLRL